MSPEMIELADGVDGIRLGQFVKLAGLLDSGGEAKTAISAGAVSVNGRTETHRGRQLVPGDVVSAFGREVQVGLTG